MTASPQENQHRRWAQKSPESHPGPLTFAHSKGTWHKDRQRQTRAGSVVHPPPEPCPAPKLRGALARTGHAIFLSTQRLMPTHSLARSCFVVPIPDSARSLAPTIHNELDPVIQTGIGYNSTSSQKAGTTQAQSSLLKPLCTNKVAGALGLRSGNAKCDVLLAVERSLRPHASASRNGLHRKPDTGTKYSAACQWLKPMDE